MAFEDMDQDIDVEETIPPEEASNRPFFIVAGILGGIMLLSLICLALYALFYLPQQRMDRATQVAAINIQNTEIAFAAQQTSDAASWTATPSPTVPLPTDTPVPPTATQVVAAATQVLSSPTPDPRTATVAALLTQAAAAQQTITPTAAGLPQTGFAEDVGIPGLFALSLVLIGALFLARRLRTAS
jgi:LPXTG-motif cell wall-anchored protein